jgi:hypothetical protein
LQDVSVAWVDRPQRHALPDRKKMYRASEIGFSDCHGTHAACWRGRRAMSEPGFTKTTAGSPSAVTRDIPGRLSTKDCPLDNSVLEIAVLGDPKMTANASWVRRDSVRMGVLVIRKTSIFAQYSKAATFQSFSDVAAGWGLPPLGRVA